jgi:hypothetical protein
MGYVEGEMMDTKRFVKDRDEAFTDFVLTGNTKKVRAYCKKYGMPIPKNNKVFAAGIYKAVQQCTNIPEEVKAKAFMNCLELGFSPLMNLGEGE